MESPNVEPRKAENRVMASRGPRMGEMRVYRSKGTKFQLSRMKRSGDLLSSMVTLVNEVNDTYYILEICWESRS